MRQRPTKEEAATMRERAETLFDEAIRPQLDLSRPHDYVMIDVESGDFEVDESEIEAATRLRARRPNGLIWCRKVGSPYAHRFRTPRRTPR